MNGMTPKEKEGRRFIQLARRAGWKYDRTTSGHWRIWPPGAEIPIQFAGSSGDVNAWKMVANDVKRAGIYTAIAKREEKRASQVEAEFNAIPKNLKLDVDKFLDAVEDRIEELGLTQTQAAERIGCPVSKLRSVLYGKTDLNMDLVYGMCSLGINLDGSRTREVKNQNGIKAIEESIESITPEVIEMTGVDLAERLRSLSRELVKLAGEVLNLEKRHREELAKKDLAKKEPARTR